MQEPLQNRAISPWITGPRACAWRHVRKKGCEDGGAKRPRFFRFAQTGQHSMLPLTNTDVCGMVVSEGGREMAEIERERVSLYITPEAAKSLRRLAMGMGFLITSGRGAGRGSVSAFMEAIAEGGVQVNRKLDDAALQALFQSGDATPVAFVSEDQFARLVARGNLVAITPSENVKREP